ncbi:MAG: NfeD family protein [Cocleimonas sp.]|nr:NfeD family protein [Cocleimonas sp.]
MYLSKASFGEREISESSDKLKEIRRIVRNAYFEHVNPKLGKMREEVNGFGFLKRLFVSNDLSMWFGIAAGITGLLLLLDSSFYWYWQLLLMLFIIFVGPLIFQLIRTVYLGADTVLAVYPGKQLIGQKITLKKEIVNGVSEAVLQGDSWEIQGDDLAAGTRVKVVAVKKNTLYVVNAMKAFDKDDKP